ncbi:MAG: aspartate-semialdehyde dehydrogenase [Candidatus Carbobacillus altaicus]|nr:aspartate-semialdehyde dehydrogenase [Candidatus Carbobacillus altaicus]
MTVQETSYRIAIVGATGVVGQEMIRQLEKSRVPVASLKLLASERSRGKMLHFRGEPYTVEVADPSVFSSVDVVLMSAGSSTARALAPEAARRGAIVIDNSSAFRMEEDVPLVVPEVNPEALATHRGIIANPNCSTTQMVVALKPLALRYGLKRVVVSTYQAVSGAGAGAVHQLQSELEAAQRGETVEPSYLPVASLNVKYPIVDNVLPQIDRFETNGFTFEEMKMIRETQKILDAPELEIAATCVRVPVTVGHSESVYVELGRELDDMDEVMETLRAQEGLVLWDDPSVQKFPTPHLVRGENEVYVGRVRRDLYRANGLHLWIVADNLVKGAAGNAVQILEKLIDNDLL